MCFSMCLYLRHASAEGGAMRLRDGGNTKGTGVVTDRANHENVSSHRIVGTPSSSPLSGSNFISHVVGSPGGPCTPNHDRVVNGACKLRGRRVQMSTLRTLDDVHTLTFKCPLKWTRSTLPISSAHLYKSQSSRSSRQTTGSPGPTSSGSRFARFLRKLQIRRAR